MADISSLIAQFGQNAGNGLAAGVNRGVNRMERNRLLELQRQDAQAQAQQEAIAKKRQEQRDSLRSGVEVLQSLPPEQRPQAWQGMRQNWEKQGYDLNGEPEQWDDSMLPKLQGIAGVAAPKGAQTSIGTYNPRDYTSESFAKFSQTGDPGVLERYAPTQTVDSGGVTYAFDPVSQEFKPLRSVQDVANDKGVIERTTKREARAGTGEGAAQVAGQEAEAAAAITSAREQAKLQAQKVISEQGQLNKLSDAENVYEALKSADLDIIYGKGEAWVPEYLRSQKGIDLIAQRDQLVGMLKLGARGELKGQGPITEGEQGILGQAITVLENPNISPDLAKSALESAINVLRRNAGVSTDVRQATADQAAANPPVEGAKQAPDGNWYVEQNGQYFRVDS